MKIEVSNGEIVDKFTILQIKKEKCDDSKKLLSISKELSYLQLIVDKLKVPENLLMSLKLINQKLWDIEDEIRKYESKKIFDDKFIELARSVYITNDQRFLIKLQINQVTNSKFIEQKILPDYG